MSIKSRGMGIPVRGGGGSGGGSLETFNTDLDNEVNSKTTKIVWNTASFGFVATQHPTDEDTIVIGAAPIFSPDYPEGVSAVATTSVRVAESDGDVFITDGWEDTNHLASKSDTPSWTSDTITGFGEAAKATVTVTQGNTTLESQVFSSSSNGTTTSGEITQIITGYSEDGDGSIYQGKLGIKVNVSTLLGNVSGKIKVHISFLTDDVKTHTFTEEYFYEHDTTTPVIDTIPTIAETSDTTDKVVKFISGVSYYTTGAVFNVDCADINRHNQESSKPSGSLTIDAEDYGITSFTTSPWTNSADWTNVSNLDTASDFGYGSEITVDMTNHRWVGPATTDCTIRDSWSDAVVKSTANSAIAVDTYIDNDTDLIAAFNGEDYRLKGDYTTSWEGEVQLVDGEAAVFGGSLIHPATLHTIKDGGAEGGSGSAANMASYKPTIAGLQPNYSGYSSDTAVYFREFLAPSSSSSYSTMNFTITTTNGIATDFSNGDVKLYIWKLGSTDTSSPNLTLPVNYTLATKDVSIEHGLWLHSPYDFGNFDDGATSSASTSGCRDNLSGSTATVSFGTASVKVGVLVRIEVTANTKIQHIVASF